MAKPRDGALRERSPPSSNRGHPSGKNLEEAEGATGRGRGMRRGFELSSGSAPCSPGGELGPRERVSGVGRSTDQRNVEIATGGGGWGQRERKKREQRRQREEKEVAVNVILRSSEG